MGNGEKAARAVGATVGGPAPTKEGGRDRQTLKDGLRLALDRGSPPAGEWYVPLRVTDPAPSTASGPTFFPCVFFPLCQGRPRRRICLSFAPFRFLAISSECRPRPFSLLTPALGSLCGAAAGPLAFLYLSVSRSLSLQFQLLEHTSVSAGPLPSAIASRALLVASRTLDSVRSCWFYYVTLSLSLLVVSAHISSFDIRQLKPSAQIRPSPL